MADDDRNEYPEDDEEESAMEKYAKKMAGPDKEKPVDNDLVVDIEYIPDEEKEYDINYKSVDIDEHERHEMKEKKHEKKKYEL